MLHTILRYIKQQPTLFILIGLALPPLLWWLHGNEIVHLADFYFPLDPGVAFPKTLAVWDSYEHNGTDLGVTLSVPKLLIYGVTALLAKIGFSTSIILRGYFFLSLLLPALAMFLLVKEIKPDKPWMPLIAGAFIMYNPYMVYMVTDTPIIITMTLVPLVLWLLLRSIRLGNPIFHGLAIGLTTFIFNCQNPSSYSVGLVILIVSTLGMLLWRYRSGKSIKSLTLTLVLACVSALILNAALLYSFYIGSRGSGVVFSGIGSRFDIDFVKFVSSYSSPFNVIRLIGAIAFFEGLGDEPYWPFARPYVKSLFITLLTLTLPALALLGTIRVRSGLTKAIGWGVLLAIFLAMGMHQPMTILYKWLYTHVPGFWIWRSAWYKWSLPITLGYAVLIAYAVQSFLEGKRELIQKRIVTAFIGLFVVIGYPLFLGFVLWPASATKSLPPARIALPPYVYQTIDYINNQPKNGGVAGLQQLMLESTFYKWKYAAIRSFWADAFTDRAVVYNMYNTGLPTYPLIDLIRKSYRDERFPISRVFNILRLEYLVHQDDFRYQFFDPNAEKWQLSLVDKEIMKKLPLTPGPSYGPWSIYKNNSLWPETFITTGVYELTELKDIQKLPDKPVAFTLRDTTKPESLLIPLGSDSTSEALTAKRPSKLIWHYDIAASPKDRVLVFNQSYSPYWSATVNGQELEHYSMNSYANGFRVPANRAGKVIIAYRVQETFERLLWLSAIGLLITILGLRVSRRWFKKRGTHDL